MKGALTFVAMMALVGMASAMCPNSCSGHGTCGANDLCTCFAGFTATDCSERKCAYSHAFVDVATGVEDAHNYAECGNQGVCDRKTGLCKCFAGYTGKACARADCPNRCSGHGTCELIEDLATDTAATVGGNALYTYTAWDAGKIQGCKCDPSYEGADCSLRKCPVGDDPLTSCTDPAAEVQTISFATTGTAGQIVIGFTDSMNKKWYTRPITTWDLSAVDWSAETAPSVEYVAQDLARALTELPNHVIESVTVSSTEAAAAATFAITFDSDHNTGDIPLITVETAGCTTAGCQPYYTGPVTTTVTVAETTKGTGEAAVCSNRGVCDSDTGLCGCHAGYTDEACSQQTVLV
jgi:hypothetical protein